MNESISQEELQQLRNAPDAVLDKALQSAGVSREQYEQDMEAATVTGIADQIKSQLPINGGAMNTGIHKITDLLDHYKTDYEMALRAWYRNKQCGTMPRPAHYYLTTNQGAAINQAVANELRNADKSDPQGYETALCAAFKSHFANAINLPWSRDYGLTPHSATEIIKRVAVEFLDPAQLDPQHNHGKGFDMEPVEYPAPDEASALEFALMRPNGTPFRSLFGDNYKGDNYKRIEELFESCSRYPHKYTGVVALCTVEYWDSLGNEDKIESHNKALNTPLPELWINEANNWIPTIIVADADQMQRQDQQKPQPEPLPYHSSEGQRLRAVGKVYKGVHGMVWSSTIGRWK